MTPPRLFMLELRVADWPRALAWYRDVLGLAVLLMDEPRRFALLDAGLCHLALKAGATSGADRDAVRLVFEVDDIDAARARLIGLGVAVSEPVLNAEEDYREARLRDPEGTPIHLFAWTTPE